MKTRIAIPLFCALSFLMVSAGIGYAQMGLHPIYLDVTLDSSTITYNLNQETVPSYTVKGIVTYSPPTQQPADVSMTLGGAKQWVVSTKINGVTAQNGDIIRITPGQSMPVELNITPYAEKADTETFSVIFGSAGGTYITLFVTDTKAAVNTLPSPNLSISPNPATGSITIKGAPINTQSVWVLDVLGKSVIEISHPNSSDFTLDLSKLPAGIYFVRLSSAGSVITRKIVKE